MVNCADSLWPSHIWWLVTKPKPLPEPMFANHQWGLVAFNWWQFLWKCSSYLSLVWVKETKLNLYSCGKSSQYLNERDSTFVTPNTLQWRHNGRDSVSNHQPHDCFLKRLIRRRSKKASKLRVTGHCAGNSPGTGEFPAQMASNAENVSIWWRHHETL